MEDEAKPMDEVQEEDEKMPMGAPVEGAEVSDEEDDMEDEDEDEEGDDEEDEEDKV